MRIARASIIVGSILLAAAGGLAPVQAQSQGQSVTERREAAVRQARAGQLDEGIAALRALLAAGADDGKVAMDLTVLLQQAGRPEEATAVFEAAKTPLPPDYAMLAAARAYRDLKRYPEAEALARTGMFRFPDQTVWPLLLSLVLSDAGRPAEALDLLAQPAAARASEPERRLAEGYAQRRAGQPYDALAAYMRVLDLAPDNAEARTAAADILREQGAPFGAAAIAGARPSDAAEEAAARVRWGESIRPSDPAHRFDGVDAAIARLDALLAALPPSETAQRRRLRLDRLVALHDRVRMKDVVADAEALRADGALPPYAEVVYGDALLYLRRPEEARDAYRRALAAAPKDIDARYGLFYAAAELEDFDTAYATIDALAADLPVWLSFKDDPVRHADPARAYAEVTAANARYYGDDLAGAWDRLTGITEAAPANPWARLALYQVAGARGWPRRAKAEGEIAASLDPDSAGSKVALAEIAIADYRFAEAKKMVAALSAQYPEDARIRRLARDLDATLGWVFEVEAKPSDSEGGGANASGEALTLQSKLTSPPVGDHWQVYALADHANAHPPEGYVERSRLSGGVLMRTADVTASLYGSQSWGALAKPGVGATLDWLANDQVRLGAAAERYSWETPLRAILHGITADSVSAKATYRWSESREVSGGLTYMPFSDGNRRFSAGLEFTQKLLALPHLDLDGGVEFYASHNDRPEAPYFNPDRDLTAVARITAEHVLWRRYEVILTQALTADAGVYAQAGHRSDLIATVSYEHRWRFDPRLEFHYGLQLSRRVYDGDVENTAALTVGLRGRF
jgi:biofilm PGA synthesis protein PgaA